ncbi:MAG: transcriptional regulator [Cupriavidus necator]
MAKRTWNRQTAQDRIETRLAEVKTVEIRQYGRDTDLTGLPNGVAYRVDGVHVYVDILNLDDMLGATNFEGVTVHRRTLRFLNLHFRAVRNILVDVDAIEVDFHNQRLHAVFAKPYEDEAKRIHKAVATAQLIIEVLAQTGEGGADPLPAAKVRVGIDSGEALAVNSGRRGHREPLFLGCAANLAAKRAGGGAKAGIFMTNNARTAAGMAEAANVDTVALTGEEIQKSQDKAKLGITVDSVVKSWKEDLEKFPIAAFEFSAHTPPFRDLDLELLTPKNSRRQDAVSIYADIDGFTSYVADRIDDDESAKDVVRALHVLRAELDAALYTDLAGVKVRFIGDCLHGLLVEGTAANTDAEESAKNALLCAAAMRSGFQLAMEQLSDAEVDVGDMGIAIGCDFGTLAITRLGMKGEMVRCVVGRAVLRSEDEQRRCDGDQTAIGEALARSAPAAFRELFGVSRRRSGFDYDAATTALDRAETAKKAAAAASGGGLLRQATTAAAAGFSFPARPAAPSKTPAGFA